MKKKKKNQIKNILPLPGESWLYQPLLLPLHHWALHHGPHQSLYLPVICEKDLSRYGPMLSGFFHYSDFTMIKISSQVAFF